MRQRGWMRGWLGVGLAAALLAPGMPISPASAGPFDYIKKADEERQKSQEREREQQERQREQQRQEQDRRAQESRQREQQERQREQQERARQEQDRRAAEERQRQAERERQAEQQRQAQERARQQEQQRQAERERAERQREQQERQREQQERARAAQEARERERQHEERTRAQQEQQARRAAEERQAREAEAQRAQESQAQEERARAVQQEQARQAQLRQEQARRIQQEQLQQQQQRQYQNAPRRVAAGPFDYIRKSDEARGRVAPQSAPRSAPVQREQPRSFSSDRGQGTRSGPFSTYQPQRGPQIPSRGGTQVNPSSPSVREYQFGNIRRPSPPSFGTPPTHRETQRPSGTFPAPGSVTAPTPGPTGSGPFGSVRTREPATAVTPVPRGGRGSLDSYFGRQPQRQRERDRRYGGPRYYPGGYYDPYYRSYPPYAYDPCPYDYYPPVVIYPRPSPQVVIVPAPEVVVVPEQEPIPDADRAEVESATLDEVLTDIEEAWVTGKLDLLMRHVRSDGKIQVYRDGEWTDALTREAFEEKTAQAFREYDTVSMTFAKPKRIGENEASARAEHVYKPDGDREQRVFVTYSFRRFGRSWKIVGLDYERPKRVQTDGQPDGTAVAPKPPDEAPAAAPRSSAPMPLWEHMGPAAPGQLHLVSAPPVRVRELLAAPRPRRLATLKQVRNGQRALYTLEAMRGVAPGTLAWALYRQGEKQPRETGLADVSAMPATGWLAVRTVAPQVMTLASGGPARPAAPRSRKTLRLATRTFSDPNVALVAVQPPMKATRRVTPARVKGRGAGK